VSGLKKAKKNDQVNYDFPCFNVDENLTNDKKIKTEFYGYPDVRHTSIIMVLISDIFLDQAGNQDT
jgi:hypothetical protein